MAIADSGVGVDYSGDFYDEILRNHFLPEVADGLNHDYYLLDLLSKLKDKSMVQGKFVQHPIHTGRNASGVGAVGIRGKLPTPSAQSYDSYQYPIRSLYARILFTGLVSDASKSDIDSWLRAVDSEMTGIRDDLARQENRICQGLGSGILCVTSVAAQANNATQDITGFPPGLEGSGTFDTAAMDYTHFIQPGMNLVGVDATTPFDVNAGGTVLSVTANEIVFTAATDSTSATGDVYWCTANENDTAAGDEKSTSFQREPMGLSGIVSDSDIDTYAYHESLVGFQNVLSSGNDFNQAVLLDNSSVRRPLTEALLQKATSQVEKKLKGKTSVWVGSYGVRDAFADLLLTYRRHVNRKELSAGFTTVSYNDVPIVPDRDAYPNRLLGVDLSDIRQHVMGSADYRFIDEDGSIYHRLPDEHSFQAAMYRRWTLGSMTRGRHVAILDLDE